MGHDALQWVDFHSAVQYVAGLNLALFALPALRQPAIEQEGKACESLQALAPLGHPQAAPAARVADDFHEARHRLEQRNRGLRWACLGIAAASSLVLMWATLWAKHTANLWIAWATASLGLLPGAGLFVLDRLAFRELSGIRRKREVVQKDIKAPGALPVEESGAAKAERPTGMAPAP